VAGAARPRGHLGLVGTRCGGSAGPAWMARDSAAREGGRCGTHGAKRRPLRRVCARGGATRGLARGGPITSIRAIGKRTVTTPMIAWSSRSTSATLLLTARDSPLNDNPRFSAHFAQEAFAEDWRMRQASARGGLMTARRQWACRNGDHPSGIVGPAGHVSVAQTRRRRPLARAGVVRAYSGGCLR
jgi:hypothetical protein